MLTNGGEGWRVRVCANDCCVAPAPITVLPSMRMRVKWYVRGSLRRSTNTNTLPDIGRTGGADGDGDGEGKGGGKRVGEGEGEARGDGVGESAGEEVGVDGEGLDAPAAVAPDLGPQPALSRRAATAMPARRCVPLILVLSNAATTVRLRVASVT